MCVRTWLVCCMSCVCEFIEITVILTLFLTLVHSRFHLLKHVPRCCVYSNVRGSCWLTTCQILQHYCTWRVVCPTSFTGLDGDWQGWECQLKMYVVVISARMSTDVSAVETMTNPITMVGFMETSLAISRLLFHIYIYILSLEHCCTICACAFIRGRRPFLARSLSLSLSHSLFLSLSLDLSPSLSFSLSLDLSVSLKTDSLYFNLFL